MATAATNVVYNQVFKKKLADAVRVGMGGGLCFCGINMYFKNEKFYDDWVMPLFKKMEPETAHVMAKKAAKYNLVPISKLEESRLLTPPSTSSCTCSSPIGGEVLTQNTQRSQSQFIEPNYNIRGQFPLTKGEALWGHGNSVKRILGLMWLPELRKPPKDCLEKIGDMTPPETIIYFRIV